MKDFVIIDREILPLVVPAVVVTSRYQGKENCLAIAWFGVVCSQPPMVSVSIRPGRTSYPMVKNSGFFGVCVPDEMMVKEVDFVGTFPGSRINKFKKANIDYFDGEKTGVPLIKSCPVNMECRVKHVLSLGTHDIFIGEVLATYVKSELVSDGQLIGEKLPFLLYCHPQQVYYSTGKEIGKRGMSKNMI